MNTAPGQILCQYHCIDTVRFSPRSVAVHSALTGQLGRHQKQTRFAFLQNALFCWKELMSSSFLYNFPPDCIENFAHQLSKKKTFYRAVKNKILSKEDFTPAAILTPERLEGCKDINCICSMWGVSLYSNVEYLSKQMKKYKKLGKYIASCDLDNETGLFSDENIDYHSNWFPFSSFSPELHFNVLE